MCHDFSILQVLAVDPTKGSEEVFESIVDGEDEHVHEASNSDDEDNSAEEEKEDESEEEDAEEEVSKG